jgi:putative nucleotidyltransferase with HDIG domain
MRWLEELWHHSLQRAFIGRMIAGKWAGLLHPQIAYTTCLLLDVGYVIRLFSDYDKFKDMMNLTQSLQISLHEAEEKVFEVGHAEVGAALLRSWNFPEDIVVAIAQHHHNTENDVFTKIAQIANALESGKYSEPHDPSINELIETWRLELYPKISKGSTA